MIFVHIVSQHVLRDISVVYKSILMILGALERGESQLSNARKIIAILSALFTGDGFEK